MEGERKEEREIMRERATPSGWIIWVKISMSKQL
jgi:hypothetical protein